MSQLVIPSNIPWADLKAKDLEECLYWLLDEMGAKDLEWRLGGSGGGTADSGRDLEAHFYMSSPDGELTRQRWWIEAKGRSHTVEPAVVKESILNARGVASVDVLLIATNSQFSNPTRDWVKQWQETNPRPVIRLWDRYDLERLVSKHPTVAVRLFSNALSNQGKLEVVRSQFWNACHFPGESDLKRIWQQRDELEWNGQSLLAVVAGEIANGNIGERPWATGFDDETLIALVTYGFLNTPFFLLRAERVGSSDEPYWRAMAYLILVALNRFSAERVRALVDKAWECTDSTLYPEKVRQMILSPILLRLRDELRNVCTSDCSRVRTDQVILDESGIETYWDRLRLPANKAAKPKDNSVFIIEYNDVPCKVGFELDRKHGCPFLLDDEEEKIDWGQMLRVFKHVISVRNRQRKL
jgi:hypothetical protein